MTYTPKELRRYDTELIPRKPLEIDFFQRPIGKTMKYSDEIKDITHTNESGNPFPYYYLFSINFHLGQISISDFDVLFGRETLMCPNCFSRGSMLWEDGDYSQFGLCRYCNFEGDEIVSEDSRAMLEIYLGDTKYLEVPLMAIPMFVDPVLCRPSGNGYKLDAGGKALRIGAHDKPRFVIRWKEPKMRSNPVKLTIFLNGLAYT